MANNPATYAAFNRLHAASTVAQPGASITVAAEDVRLVLDGAAEIDRRTAALTRELADAKSQLIERATRTPDPPPPNPAAGSSPPNPAAGAPASGPSEGQEQPNP